VSVSLTPLVAPSGLVLASQSGVQVKVSWSAAGQGDSVEYAVWFQALDSTEFENVGKAQRTSFTHDPLGLTGWYTVSARRGTEEVFSAETVNTIPVFSDTMVLHELNSDSLAGMGWDSLTGRARLGSMRDTSDAPLLDVYLTDLTPGDTGPSFYLACAAFGPEDPGGVVPAGPWRDSRLIGLLGSIQNPLPEFDSLLYERVVDMNSSRSNAAVHTPEDFYALVSGFGTNPSAGTLRVVTWFQPIKGLRLIEHVEPKKGRK
jgi:hypothetical protein